MAIRPVLNRNRNNYQDAFGGNGYSSVTGKKAIAGGTYANGIEALSPTSPKASTGMPSLKSTLKPNVAPINSQRTGKIGSGGVRNEGVTAGGMGVIKVSPYTSTATSTTPTQAKYADHFTAAGASPEATSFATSNEMTAKNRTSIGQSRTVNSQPDGSTTKPLNATETPATYEEYLEQQKELLDKRKAEADRQAEAAKERAAVDAQASYTQNMATYGTNAERLAQMGLQGGGYSDYVNAQAYAQKRADVQQANVTEAAAKAQNRATYEDALAEIDKSELEYKEKQQEKAEAEAKGYKEKQDSIYASLWERAIDPDSNYTETNIESLGREYGLPDSQIEELKSVIRESKSERNKNIYANLLGYANNGTFSAEQIVNMAAERGLNSNQVEQLKAAANTYKNNVYKTNNGNLSSGIDSGNVTKNTLDTALENDNITQVQYNTLLEKLQKGYFDTYSNEIADSLLTFLKTNAPQNIDKAVANGEISEKQKEELKKKFNSTVEQSINQASLFYQEGLLEESAAKDLVQKLKSSGWLNENNMSAIDTHLSNQYAPPAEDDGGCYAKGTLITVADGSQIPVEELKIGDKVAVFNHNTGEIDIAPISYIFYDELKEYDVLKLSFGDDADIEVLYGHGFFDTDLKKYVLLNAETVKDYIGHNFYYVSFNNGECNKKIVPLKRYETYKKETECFSVLTAQHINSIADGLLTITDDGNVPCDILRGFVNVFELDDDFKFDKEKMVGDIEKYGLSSYDDWKEWATEEQYKAFNGDYLNVAIGKGLITADEIVGYIQKFLGSHRGE